MSKPHACIIFYRRNILPNVNSTYLSQCVFNRKTDPDCPIFRLGDIVSEANEDFQTMAVQVQEPIQAIYILVNILQEITKEVIEF